MKRAIALLLLCVAVGIPIANAVTTASTPFVFVVPVYRAVGITYGGTCAADAFFFNEQDAFLDPDPDGNFDLAEPRGSRYIQDANLLDLNFDGIGVNAITFADDFEGYESYYKIIDETNSSTEWTISANINTIQNQDENLRDGHGGLRLDMNRLKNPASTEIGITKTFGHAVDLTDFNAGGKLYYFLYIDKNATAIDGQGADLRIGSSPTDYYLFRNTLPWGQSFQDGWNIIPFDFSSAFSVTGTPDMSNVNYVGASINEPLGAGDHYFTLNRIWAERPLGPFNDRWRQFTAVGSFPLGYSMVDTNTTTGNHYMNTANIDWPVFQFRSRIFIPTMGSTYLNSQDYNLTASANVQLFDVNEQAGFIFDYVNPANYSRVYFDDTNYPSVQLTVENVTGGSSVKTEAPYIILKKKWYNLRFVTSNNDVAVYVDGNLGLNATLPARVNGNIGAATVRNRAFFDNVSVSFTKVSNQTAQNKRVFFAGNGVLAPIIEFPSIEGDVNDYRAVAQDDLDVNLLKVSQALRNPMVRATFNLTQTSVEPNRIKDFNMVFIGQSLTGTSCETGDGAVGDILVEAWNYFQGGWETLTILYGSGASVVGKKDTQYVQIYRDGNVLPFILPDQNIHFRITGTGTGAGGVTACLFTDLIHFTARAYPLSTDFCQGDVPAMTLENVGNSEIQALDGNFEANFTGTDVNLTMRVWASEVGTCQPANVIEETCSISDPDLETVSSTQCRLYSNGTDAGISALLLETLTVDENKGLCFAGGVAGFTQSGDHNHTFGISTQ